MPGRHLHVYVPAYVVFNWLSPIVTVFFAPFNLGIRRYSAAELAQLAPADQD